MKSARLIRKLFLSTVITLSLAASGTASAGQAACGELGGGVLFKDMMYGLGAGVVVSGLVMAVQDNYDHAGRRLAGGGLLGSALGLGIGVGEVFLRDCHAAIKPGWQPARMAYVPANRSYNRSSGFMMNLTYVLPD